MQEDHEHTHTASHIHEHTHTGIHAHGEDSNYNYTIIKKRTSSTGITLNHSAIYNDIDKISLYTSGFNAEYVLQRNGADIKVSIWDKSNIMSNVYPDKGIALAWYDEYKAIYKEKWLVQRFGIRVSNGIKVNQNPQQELYLVDGDGCKYDTIKISVKAPENGSFDVVSTTNPTNACMKNGTATIRYNGGGVPPYVHSAGSLSATNRTITVPYLGYGDTLIRFYSDPSLINKSASFPVTIGNSSVGITGVQITKQTCPTANGTVTINTGSITGIKTYTLTCDDNSTAVYTHFTAENSYTFPGLIGGNYSATVTSETCSFTRKNIFVGKEIFGIKPIIPTVDATTLGGTGSATIFFENGTTDIAIIGVPSNFIVSKNASSVSYSGLIPGNYNFTVQRPNAGGVACSVAGSFTIHGPEFKASVSLDETDNGFTASARLISSGLISPYTLRLLNASTLVAESEPNGTLSKSNLAKGSYTIELSYTVGNENRYEDVTICSFTYPLATINNVNQVTAPTCHGGVGSIKLMPTGGIAGGNLLVSLIGLEFTNMLSYTPKGGDFSYYIKSEKSEPTDVLGNTVTVNKSVVKQYTINIPQPEQVRARVISDDVTCAGKHDGRVSVDSLKGGSGIYQYKVGEGAWTNPSVVTTGLDTGYYKVYLKDNNCESVYLTDIEIKQPDSLKVERMAVTQPTCELENGAILVE
ncbi:hypothetical protein, partial [Williamwhitmania taraxaci]